MKITEKTQGYNALDASFIVEKNGQLTGFKIIGGTDYAMTSDLAAMLQKCKNWVPGTHFGIPFRCRVRVPLLYYKDGGHILYYNETVKD